MIDELLGRAELKDRITELEAELAELRDERDELERKLSKADRERREAIRKRQDAAEEINRLEDRIAQLEGEVERLSDDSHELYFRKTATLSQTEMASVVTWLSTIQGSDEQFLTAAVGKSPPEALRNHFGQRAALLDRASPCIVVSDSRRIISAAFQPPIQPDDFFEWAEGPVLNREWFVPSGSYTFALVRSDLFAMAEYQGTEQQSVTGFQSDVMGDHSKGGFSQSRFERRREEQRANHLDRCRKQLTNRSCDRLYLVGEQTALDELDFDATVTATVDATGDPEEAIGDAYRDFWKTTLYLL